jgi:hypothetical protein
MMYIADLGQGRSLHIENVGAQTIIIWESHRAGQQQRQQMSLSLGQWLASPMVFKTASGFILQIESNQSAAYVRLQVNSISLLTEPPLMLSAEAIPLRYDASPRPPESIRAENTSARRESIAPPPARFSSATAASDSGSVSNSSVSNSSASQFCSQCGAKVKEIDRFCSRCGTKLGL